LHNKIQLTAEGRAIVPVDVKPFNELKLIRVHFKVDTGADITTISKKELNVLGYDEMWIKNNTKEHPTRRVTRAGGGEEPAYYVQIPKCNVLGRDLSHWPFHIYIMTDEEKERYKNKDADFDFPNLLGIDILSHFDFSFNYSKGDLIIQPIAVSAIKLEMIDNQSIFELQSFNG